MRRIFMLPIAAALVFGPLAINSDRVEAMIGNPGLQRFADALSPIEKAACWRYGWHGWGWYPCGWGHRYYGGYYGGRWGWHRGWDGTVAGTAAGMADGTVAGTVAGMADGMADGTVAGVAAGTVVGTAGKSRSRPGLRSNDRAQPRRDLSRRGADRRAAPCAARPGLPWWRPLRVCRH
jgi:hypothetical protein